MDEATKDTAGTTHRPSIDSHLKIEAGASHSDIERQSVDNDLEESKERTDEKATRDPNIVGWDGPNDPENPQNWPTRKKVTAVAMASMITFLS
jgi:hypothetical protein